MKFNPWAWWVARVNRPIDVRPFALMRISLTLAVLVDQLKMLAAGMVGPAYQLFEYGGLAGFHRQAYWFLDAGPLAGPALWAVMMVCMVCVALGVATRPAMLIGVLASAQLGHLFPTGDRGVDRMVRTVLLILIFTNAHRCYSLGNLIRRRPRLRSTPGWASDILHLFLVLVYMAAGLVKAGKAAWWSWKGSPMLYRILADPMSAHLDPQSPFWRKMWPLMRISGSISVTWELMSPIFLTRYAHWWGFVGITMHIGIALLMKLGMFSYGMVSWAFVVMAPLLLPLIDRVEERLGFWAKDTPVEGAANAAEPHVQPR
jgi:hypothetical protein